MRDIAYYWIILSTLAHLIGFGFALFIQHVQFKPGTRFHALMQWGLSISFLIAFSSGLTAFVAVAVFIQSQTLTLIFWIGLLIFLPLIRRHIIPYYLAMEAVFIIMSGVNFIILDWIMTLFPQNTVSMVLYFLVLAIVLAAQVYTLPAICNQIRAQFLRLNIVAFQKNSLGA